MHGRLIRAENKIDRQKAEITDMRTRMMRDNIIIRSKGEKYKATKDENTATIFRNFVDKELRVADAGNIAIPRAHRMGQASGQFNKMIIAKVPSQSDQSRIFANVKALKGTDFTLNKQYPPPRWMRGDNLAGPSSSELKSLKHLLDMKVLA